MKGILLLELHAQNNSAPLISRYFFTPDLTNMIEQIAFHLLGGVSIDHNSAPIGHALTRKVTALLVYLVYSPGPHSRTSLSDLLWTDQDEQHGQGSLRVALTDLRKQFDVHIVATRDAVEINPASEIYVDALAFRKTAEAATRSLASDSKLSDHSTRLLEEALTLYRGDFLHGFDLRNAEGFETWMRQERESLHALAVRAAELLTQHSYDRQDIEACIRHAQRLIGIEPLHEDGYRWLMQALMSAGQTSTALAYYEMLRRKLASEVNVGPSPELVTLAQEIRARSRRSSHPRSRMPSTPSSIANNLPALLTTFVGREVEVSQLLARIVATDCRLLTIHGPGGIGKTSLAIAVGHRLLGLPAAREAFNDGIFFVRLESVDGAALPAALGHALGWRMGSGASSSENVIDLLRDQQALLILDNVEHIEDYRDFFLTLLERAPKIKLMITARERLDYQAEWLYTLIGLPYPTHDDDEYWQDYPAVKLFAQAAQSVQPAFSLLTQRHAVLSICQLVAGLPLALRLAGTSVRSYSCQHIADALARTMDFLSSTMRDLPQRQRSLRAVFDHSWRLLELSDKIGFARLTVFVGAFTAQAAQQVADIDEPLLLRLVDRSFVQVETDTAKSSDAEVRFSIHPMLRQYGAEHLSAQGGEIDSVLDRHAHFYVNLLQAQQAILQSRKRLTAVTMIGQELSNVKSMWKHLILTQDAASIAVVHRSLTDYYLQIGPIHEGEEMIAAAVPIAANLAGSHGELGCLHCQLLLDQAQLQIERALFAQAIATANAANASAHKHGDTMHIAHSMQVLGQAYFQHGDYSNACDFLQQALTLATPLAAATILSPAHLYLGLSHAYQGRYELVRKHLDQAHLLTQAYDDISTRLKVERGQSLMEFFQGHYAATRQILTRILADYQELGERANLITPYLSMGALAQHLGDFEAALKYYQECQSLFRAVGSLLYEGIVLGNLSLLLHQMGDQRLALSYAQKAITSARTRAARDEEAYAHVTLGHARLALGDVAGARDAYATALTLRESLGQGDQRMEPLAGLVRVALAEGKPADALGQVGEIMGLVMRGTFGGVAEPFRVMLTCYEVLKAVGDPQAAVVLQRTYAQLRRRADLLHDAKEREVYLTRPPTHRALVKAAQAAGLDGETPGASEQPAALSTKP